MIIKTVLLCLLLFPESKSVGSWLEIPANTKGTMRRASRFCSKNTVPTVNTKVVMVGCFGNSLQIFNFLFSSHSSGRLIKVVPIQFMDFCCVSSVDGSLGPTIINWNNSIDFG